jgi:PAS domain S-box-containing protein
VKDPTSSKENNFLSQIEILESTKNSIGEIRARMTDFLGKSFGDLIDVMDIAVWELDLNYRVIAFNQKARKIYGKNAKGKFCYSVAAGRNSVCPDCPAKMVYNGHKSGRSEHRRVDVTGKTIYIDHIATPIKDKKGSLKGILIVIIDITRRKQMEEEIRKHRNQLAEMVEEQTLELKQSKIRYENLYHKSKSSEELYQSLLNSSPDAIVIYDLQGNAKYVSPGFTRLFGYTLADVEGRRIPFVPESEKEVTTQHIKNIVQKGQICQGIETKRYSNDGRLIDVSISAARFIDHLGNPAGVVVILRDITETKKLWAQLQQAQKMEAIGTLAGGIAHDFNNLLMGIQGRASLMLSDINSRHPVYEHIKGIEEYVKSATDLTRQLLGFARGGKYIVKPVYINKVVEHSIQMFGRTHKEIRIVKMLATNLWTVEVDTGQIEQVLLNLFVNAWHAMPAGGDLYLQTENIILDKAYVKPFKAGPGKYVKISVTDTGVGMDDKTLKRIFDPFFTTRDMGRGAGLGLASTYGIIKNHNGIINAYSEKGKGSTFNIYLPVSNKHMTKEMGSSKLPVGGNETILLVDDEPVIMEVTKPMLEVLGYKVYCAGSGQEAIDIIRQKGETIDLVILDMIMPGIGGAETFDQLKLMNKEIPVILSSGYSLNGQAEQILEKGCCGFIQKPFNLDELSEKIRKALT